MPYIKPIKEVIKEQSQAYLNQLNIKQNQLTPPPKDNKQQFYNSKGWKVLRQQKLHEQPLCEVCQQRGLVTPGSQVHHAIRFFEQYDENMKWMLLLDYDNLVTVCDKCHQHIHKQRDKYLWPEQRKYLDDKKSFVSQKYLDNGIIIKWTEDTNFPTRKNY